MIDYIVDNESLCVFNNNIYVYCYYRYFKICKFLLNVVFDKYFFNWFFYIFFWDSLCVKFVLSIWWKMCYLKL